VTVEEGQRRICSLLDFFFPLFDVTFWSNNNAKCNERRMRARFLSTGINTSQSQSIKYCTVYSRIGRRMENQRNAQ
jgi:hypothetical protein